jgi:hypothetical protein
MGVGGAGNGRASAECPYLVDIDGNTYVYKTFEVGWVGTANKEVTFSRGDRLFGFGLVLPVANMELFAVVTSSRTVCMAGPAHLGTCVTAITSGRAAPPEEDRCQVWGQHRFRACQSPRTC